MGWMAWTARVYRIDVLSVSCKSLLADSSTMIDVRQATKDPFYLRVGERVLSDLKRRTMTECGFATMKNVDTGEVSGRAFI